MRNTIKNLVSAIIVLFKSLFKRKVVIGKNAVDRIVNEKFNWLGSSRRKGRNVNLYAYDPMTELVTKVPLIEQKGGGYRSFITPLHKLTWAINLKNAERKLFKAYRDNKNITEA